MELRDVTSKNLLTTSSVEAKEGSLRTHHLNMMCSRGKEVPRPEIHGFCGLQGEFHMFEGVEGKRLVMAMKALEEKILAKVEKSLVAMREEMKQENASLEKGVSCVAADQKELCSKVDDISMEALESRSDLLDRLDEISREALESRIDCLASLEDIDTKIKHIQTTTVGIESLESQLDKDILQQNSAELSARELDIETKKAAASMKIESLEAQLEREILLQNGADFDCTDQEEHVDVYEAEVQAMGNTAAAEATVPNAPVSQTSEKMSSDAKETSACSLDLAHQQSSKLPPTPYDQIQDMWSTASLNWTAAASYSSKASIAGASYSRKPAPFAQGFTIHRPRPVGRMTSCHSAPLLEPLF
jgi:hypothetical protein